MTASEAIAYCATSPTTEEDGERVSAVVCDRNRDRHWIVWEKLRLHWDVPDLCSESPYPFSPQLEPYSPVDAHAEIDNEND